MQVNGDVVVGVGMGLGAGGQLLAGELLERGLVEAGRSESPVWVVGMVTCWAASWLVTWLLMKALAQVSRPPATTSTTGEEQARP